MYSVERCIPLNGYASRWAVMLAGSVVNAVVIMLWCGLIAPAVGQIDGRSASDAVVLLLQ